MHHHKLSHSCIGVLSPLIGGFYYGSIIEAVQIAAAEQGVQVLAIQTVGERFNELSSVESPVAWEHVDGWIVFPEATSLATLLRLKATGVPLVTLSMVVPELEVPSVLPNNSAGTATLVRHLIDHGHERIAFVGVLDNLDIQQRFAGYQAAMAERDIAFDPALVLHTGGWMQEHGAATAQRLLASATPCTAIVCATDLLALGVLQQVQVAGLAVPEQMAVVGFDDIAAAEYAQPPLTTVRQRFDALGREASRLVLAALAGEQLPAETTYVDTMVVQRQSCGCTAEAISGETQDQIPAEANWREALLAQLVKLVLHPYQLPPHRWPAHIRTCVELLLHALQAAMEGGEPLSQAALGDALCQLSRATTNPEALDQIFFLLQEAADHLAAREPTTGAVRARQFAQVLMRELRRAWSVQERQERQHLEDAIEINYRINIHMFRRYGDGENLDWLSHTPMQLGCLGLWAHAEGEPESIKIGGVFTPAGLGQPLIGQSYTPESFPPRALLDQARRYPGTITSVIFVRTVAHQWGLLALVGPVESRIVLGMGGGITQWAGMLSMALERDTLFASVERQREELRLVTDDAVQARITAEQANELKSKFLSNMSHELRTPLNSIINFAKLIGREAFGSLSETQLDFQRRIVDNGTHLLELINNILDLAKIEAGRMELFCEEVALPPLLQGVMAMANGLTKEKGLGLVLDVAEPLPSVSLDKTRIRQVLLNLLSNAVKFTEQGTITLRCRTLFEAGLVEFSVADSGIGIAPEHQALVFEEFRQVDDARTRQYQGTGLGLPICKKLVELHGGAMWLESSVGVGSTFSFVIPIKPQGTLVHRFGRDQQSPGAPAGGAA